jgi:cytochrome b
VIRVWDPFVRAFHWTLIASVAVAWITHEGGAGVHEAAGYCALGLVAARIVWGIVGSEHARFSAFIRSPRATWDYARGLAVGRDERYVGHNPLGAWMIVALLADIIVCCSSGWLYTTDAYWGVEWVAELHEVSADLLLVLIALHVGGVLSSSWRHRENLVAAMIHGRKRPSVVE